MTDLPRTIADVVILSDSKSALQAIQRPKNNRRGIIIEIQLMVDQLRYRGTNVTFQWIPSHVGIAGNDEADRAAKEGANLPHVTDQLGMTASEAYSKLRDHAWAEWSESYRVSAAAKGWIEPAVSKEGTFPCLSAHLFPLFYRLRGRTFRTQFCRQQCSCQADLSFSHLFSCPRLIPRMDTVNALGKEYNIQLNQQSLLTKHDTLGWRVTTAFLGGLQTSEIGHML
jgi:hypothetical protein